MFNKIIPCLQVSATVQGFLPGWVGLKKKRQNDDSCGNFGMDATLKPENELTTFPIKSYRRKLYKILKKLYQTEIACKIIQKKTTPNFLNEKITPNF